MRSLRILLGLMLVAAPALAVGTNLSTFAPSGPPFCTLLGSDPTYNGGVAADTIPATVGDTITVSLTVSNGAFTNPAIVSVNGVYVWNVVFPTQVIANVAGTWHIQYVSPGCTGNTLTITAH